MNTKARDKIHQDFYIGVIIIIISIYFLIETLSFHKESALYPQMILSLLLLLGVSISISGIKKTKQLRKGEEVEYKGEEAPLSFTILKFPLIGLLMFTVYGFLVGKIGFFSSTIIFAGVFLWFMGIRKWLTYILTIAFINVFIYIVFVLALKVRLPAGVLF